MREVHQVLRFNPIPTSQPMSLPGHSINARQDPASHLGCILVPIRAIFLFALLLIPPLTVDEKNSKVHQEEVGCNHAPASNLSSLDGSLFYRSRGRVLLIDDEVSCDTSWKTVRPRHHPIAQVVDMTSAPPPTGSKELRTAVGFDVFEV